MLSLDYISNHLFIFLKTSIDKSSYICSCSRDYDQEKFELGHNDFVYIVFWSIRTLSVERVFLKFTQKKFDQTKFLKYFLSNFENISLFGV